MDAGGKGINVAAFLADFGQPATVTGFLGADNDGIFRRLFESKGIEDRCVRIPGQTRTRGRPRMGTWGINRGRTAGL